MLKDMQTLKEILETKLERIEALLQFDDYLSPWAIEELDSAVVALKQALKLINGDSGTI